MKVWATFSLFALSASALSGVSVSGHEAHAIQRRHRQVASRALHAHALPKKSRKAGPRRLDLDKRKTPGTGDATTAPSNLAEGTATEGCAVWHTVSEGEVCLGLIDKSSSKFTMAMFLKMNPSLNADCDNLVTGKAYCVDMVAGKGSNTPAPTKASEAPVATARVAAVSQTHTGTSADDDEDLDCDDSEEEPSSTESTDDAEDCEDEETGDDTTDDAGSESEGEDCEEDTEDGTSTSDDTEETSDEAPAPAPTKQAKPAATSSSSDDDSEETENSSNSSSSSSSSSSVKLDQSGTATWYEQNGNPGNCGDYNSDDALIVALYTPQYADGSHCGKKVKLVNPSNGKTVIAKVADSCPSCEKNGNIDCSVAVFKELSDNNMGLGVLQVDWAIL